MTVSRKVLATAASAALLLAAAGPAFAQESRPGNPTELPPPGTAQAQNDTAQPVYSGPVKPLQNETAPADATAAPRALPGKKGDKFSENEVVQAAAGFFGATSEAVAKAVQKVFSEQGMPDAYIKGEEGSGAFVVGLRYGSGWLVRKGYAPVKVYWQGPSVGFDFGANASKSFMLVYNLGSGDGLYQRFPGVDGSFYFVAGIGVNYLRSGNITIAPMRTGVGLRAGVNAGYLSFTRHETANPF
jgi:hypothetical protein